MNLNIWHKTDRVANVSYDGRSHWRANEWYKEVNIVNYWLTKQERFINIEQGWNCFNLTDFTKLG